MCKQFFAGRTANEWAKCEVLRNKQHICSSAFRDGFLVGFAGCQGCSPLKTPAQNAPSDPSVAESTVGENTAPSLTAPEPATSANKNASPPPIERMVRPADQAGDSPSDETIAGESSEEPTTGQTTSEPPDAGEIPVRESPRGKKKPRDVQTTLKQINTLRESARKAKDGAEPGKAFRDVSKAWEAAKAHPEDPRCRALIEQLAAEMRELAPRANDRYRTAIPHAPLVAE